jgi:hypothetical protein
MLNARLLLGMATAALATSTACTTKTSLGHENACKPSNSQVDRSCNDDPNLPAVAGVCGSDGICSCNTGFVLSSTTKRCKLTATGDASILVCTVGADQTCNDDVNLSATAGVCQAGVACACKTGFLLNPTTGRCKGSLGDASGDSAMVGMVCTFLVDQTCNDDDAFSGTAGICMKGGTCTCNTGFSLNPSTGRCKAVTAAPDAGASGKDTAPPNVDAPAMGKDTAPPAVDAPATGKDAASVCTPGADPSCNDNPILATTLGICQSNGTCLCRSGSVVNPVSGRCAIPDAGSTACTYPINETCNDNSAASDSIRGTCQPDGTCVCTQGYLLDPSTGRCVPGRTDAGTVVSQVCTPGKDQMCSDDPKNSALQGICQANGTCACASGYEINLLTGRCMAATPGACTGTYDACGCGCCGSTSLSLACYYPSAGDSLNAIIADDQAARSNPDCAFIGCSLGQRYVCCAEGSPEPAGTAQYSAKFVVGGIDRISISKKPSDNNCATLSIASSSSTTSSQFRVATPDKWSLEATSITGGACADAGAGLRAVGGQGGVTLSPSGTTCVISAHLTLFFAVNADGGILPIRIDADDLPISGSTPGGYCQ